MDKWVGKVALVTGASSGIGKSIADKLVRSGMKVVACDYQEGKLKEHASELNKCGQGEMFPVKCDMTSEQQILDMFKYIKEKFGVLNVCVNNAGVYHMASLLDGETKQWKEMLDVNVLGHCIATREAYSLMPSDDGHIVNINSLGSYKVVDTFALYCATKYAMRALTEGLRLELRAKKSNIRTSAISPGIVATNIFKNSDTKMFDSSMETPGEHLKSSDIADAVVFVLSAPMHMDVNEIIIRPILALA